MPINLLTTPSNAVEFDDVRDIGSSGLEEGNQLEFKAALATRDGQPDRWMIDQKRIGGNARDDIAKEVVAFANAYGGIIIIGIDETEDNPKRSKQLHLPMIPRVVDCAEQLAQSLRSIIDPPFPMLEVRGIENGSNRQGVILIKVPSSASAPHGFGRPPVVYVRRGANSEPLTMRDMQSMFFERRTRFERVEQRREDQSRAAHELFEKYTSGQLPQPANTAPFGHGKGGIVFRCSLVSLENIGIDNMPDRFIGVNGRRAPRPDLNHRNLVQLPDWTYQWNRGYRAVEYVNYIGNVRYSRAAIHADGTVNLSSIYVNQDGKLHVQLYAAVVAQGMMLCEWMRRWAGRPDIEYSLDGEFMLNGGASVSSDSNFDEWTLLSGNKSRFGPYSIGPLANFSEAFKIIEGELWDLCGVRRSSRLNVDFEQLAAGLPQDNATL